MFVWMLSDVVELCLPSLLLLCSGLAFVEPLAGVRFCTSSCGACGFPRRVLPQVTLRGLRNLSGSRCLPCSCGGTMSVGFTVSFVRRLFSALCRALATAPDPPTAGYPSGFLLFSGPVCRPSCYAGAVGWVDTLPLCSQCFSSSGCLPMFAGFCTL